MNGNRLRNAQQIHASSLLSRLSRGFAWVLLAQNNYERLALIIYAQVCAIVYVLDQCRTADELLIYTGSVEVGGSIPPSSTKLPLVRSITAQSE